MYYLSLAAYYIFFNASKALYFLCMLFLAAFYVYLLSGSITEIQQELATLVGRQKATCRTLAYWKVQENYNHPVHPEANGSYCNFFEFV